jgi:hypothetical protein
MRENNNNVSQTIAISRKNLIEFFLIAIFLSYGINLIAAGQLLIWLNNKPLLVVIVGTFFCLIPVVYVSLSLYVKRVEDKEIEAFIVYDFNNNSLIKVKGYSFSEEIKSYITSACYENLAIKSRWEKESLNPFKNAQASAKGKGFEVPVEYASYQKELICQAVEYFFLQCLSNHLVSYFSGETFKKKNLTTYMRKDIPDVLLSNSILEMFSHPIEDRAAFVGHLKSEQDTKGIVALRTSSGLRYEQFHLTLPKGSKITRPQDHKIEIETKKLKIVVGISFGGITGLPRGFEKHYLRRNGSLIDIMAYNISVEIKIKVKFFALLSDIGWRYYKWIDSFVNELEKSASMKLFFERIQWENVTTILDCISNLKRGEIRQKSFNLSEALTNSEPDQGTASEFD